jgi:serine/threonine protein kinase
MPLYEFDDETQSLLIRVHLEGRFHAEVTGPFQGAFGDVYRIDQGQGTYPRYLAAKCPKISRFGSREAAAEGIEGVLREVEKTFRVLASPWVNRFVDIMYISGWPFIISQWRDGTLSDLISNPLVWNKVDRLASILQIVRALRAADARGISAHQDLKPDNIFFVDLHRKFRGAAETLGLHFQMLVGDFGNADAFRELGRNSGSRPYMAPEQYYDELVVPAGFALDVFAIGVIAHECLCDGAHPIGVVTSDVWPWKVGIPRKWDRAKQWRRWAGTVEKDLSVLRGHCPELLFPPLSSALSADPEKRPRLEDIEEKLWEALNDLDSEAGPAIRNQVEHVEADYADDAWPYFEERLSDLRRFYAERH